MNCLGEECLLGLAWDNRGQVSALSGTDFMQDLERVEQIPFIQRSLADSSVCHLSCSLRATAGGLQICSMACPLPLSGSAREDTTDLQHKLILSRIVSTPVNLIAKDRMWQKALAGGSNEQLQILYYNFFLSTAVWRRHICLNVEIPLNERQRQPWNQHKLQNQCEYRVNTCSAYAEL